MSTCIMFSDGLSYNMFKGYHLAKVWLVFCPWQSLYHPDLGGMFYAFVYWYLKIPQRPNQFMKMYKVRWELDMHGQWKSGVVKLLQLKGLCPLAPSIKGNCPSGITVDNCFDMVSDYHINHFASHSFFAIYGVHSHNNVLLYKSSSSWYKIHLKMQLMSPQSTNCTWHVAKTICIWS